MNIIVELFAQALYIILPLAFVAAVGLKMWLMYKQAREEKNSVYLGDDSK